MKDYYKIMEKDAKGNLKTLFHGLNGSRIVEQGKWLQADNKWVRDGTSETYYWSAWHIMKSKEECIDYLNAFKNLKGKIIVKCKAKEIYPKIHARKKNVFLADWIKIGDIVWEKA